MTQKKNFSVGELINAKQGIFEMAATVLEIIGDPVEKYRVSWTAKPLGGEWEEVVLAQDVSEFGVIKRRKPIPPPKEKEKRKASPSPSEENNATKKRAKKSASKTAAKPATKKSAPKPSKKKQAAQKKPSLQVGDSVKAFQGKHITDATISSVSKDVCKVKWEEPFDMSLEEETISRDSLVSPPLTRLPKKAAGPKRISSLTSSFKNTNGVPKDSYEEGDTVLAYCGGNILNTATVTKKISDEYYILKWEVPFPNQKPTAKYAKHMIQGIRQCEEEIKQELYNCDPRPDDMELVDSETCSSSDDSLTDSYLEPTDSKGKVKVLIDVCAELMSRVDALEKDLAAHKATCSCGASNDSQPLKPIRNSYSPKLQRGPKEAFQ
eukprot:TRINITY_DN7588_c0_g1_i1.p1 TRINITY_DN7588_c0_g1~~TRINITY_DN7588_c0_g1_i1.p1  ORF type:complete len:379 (+),score=91.15 TRINITY_DN7588_c0_g1_i1:424-1560(+)